MENQNPIDIILRLVVKGEIDPWNIDITILADKFLNEIKNINIPDLLTASKVLVAAALLLRMKAESLDQEKNKKEEIHRKRLFGIKRFYTIEEIAQILKDFTSPPIELEPKKDRKPYKRKNTTKKPLSFDYKLAHNILEDAIKYFEEEIKYISEVIKFSQINYPNKSQAFIALLFLNNDNKINLYQEEPFDEIYIEPIEVYNYSL